MRTRGLTCLLLGMWLAGGLFLTLIAAENFRAADRMVRDPSGAASLRIKKLGAADTLLLLRYQASEQNRYYFEVWENVQLALSLLFFFYLLFGTGENKFVLGMSLLLIVVVVLQRFLVTPEMTGLGRLLDFLPTDAPSPHRGRFRVLHATYIALEIGKWIVQAAIAAFVISRTRRTSRNIRSQLNVVDKPDYGHVNG